jgi:3-phenylpropionate/trans-cinnamate dioxygenase ferredoxin subunit
MPESSKQPAPAKPRGKRHVVCAVGALPPGERRIVEVAGRSIGVFNVDGTYHALRNACPHQLAPLCLGPVSGTTLPGEVGEFNYGLQGRVLRCPWHGWEFDLTTGRSVFNPHKVRVKCYDVEVEGKTVSIDSNAPDPEVETYEVGVEQQQVVLYV